MAAPDIKLRGIRGPMPSGYLLGRQSSGDGPPELISVSGLMKPLQNQVTSVFGRSGAIVATSGDYGVGQVTNAMSVIGTTTNDDAPAGHVGEPMSSNVPFASAIGLTTTVKVNLTSLPLTKGDWDVMLAAQFGGNAATTVDHLVAGISETSATFTGTYGPVMSLCLLNGTPFTGGNPAIGVGPYRVSLAADTTIYGVVDAFFAVNTLITFGYMRARRMR